MPATKHCPFCTLPESRVIDSSQHGLVIRDGFPISPGHTLIIPRRHTGSFFGLSVSAQLTPPYRQEVNCVMLVSM
jgi:diadenosine tetraphosphate (Ap4A) HIT family hydrolase